MRVVLYTNILISALWTTDSNPGRILEMVGRNEIIPCYDHRIINEYLHVLSRPKFKFVQRDIDSVLNRIKAKGYSIIAGESKKELTDESDRAFYDVALTCGAYLITGNLKHFPKETFIISPSQFINLYDTYKE